MEVHKCACIYVSFVFIVMNVLYLCLCMYMYALWCHYLLWYAYKRKSKSNSTVGMNDAKTYLKLNLCMLNYFYKKLEVAGMIMMTLNSLVRVLLRNYISHSYVCMSSSEDIDGQCGDLRWVPDLTLALQLGAECHRDDSAGCYQGLYLQWSLVSFFCYEPLF